MHELIKGIAAASLAALLAATGLAVAQDKYPSRPVRVIVPFAPGASTDMLARLAANELTKRLGQTFVVDNVGGAGGTIGTAQMVRAKPDGYTLVAGTPGPITISPVAQKNLTYDAAKDLAPITLIAEGPGVFVVGKNSPYKTLRELLAAAKAKPQAITFGSAGTGAFSHLNGELLKSLAGIDIIHVPYKGSGPAMIDLIAGRIDFLIEYFPAVQKFIESGDVRALGITSAKRYPLRPEIPTMAEGGVPGYESAAWVSLLAPAGTPKHIVDTIQRELSAALREPAITKQLNSLGVVPGGNTPTEFAAYLNRERAQIKKLVDATGLTINP
jgi:tripartite-type tricarboxylate transporter receptor subunit TctC